MGKSNISALELQRMLGRLGMVQEELAAVLKVNQATVSRWLGGQVDVPGYVEAWLREAHPHLFEEVQDG